MTTNHNAELSAIIAGELSLDVVPAVHTAVAAIRRQRPTGIAAILFYGSCLRDQAAADGMMDFYVVVDDFESFYSHWLARLGNWLVPPNVYYLEADSSGQRVRAKFAVISRRQLAHQTSKRAGHSTLWGRLSQPCRLIYVKDAHIRREIEQRVLGAVSTFYLANKPLLPQEFTSQDFWQGGLQRCYGTEFRAERSGRADTLYQQYADRYDKITQVLVASDDDIGGDGQAGYAWQPLPASALYARLRWFSRRIVGRGLQILRLAKAVFTFTDGLTYILHKIEKHSGQSVEPTEWQRRHPLLAAPGLAWRLYKMGGFR